MEIASKKSSFGSFWRCLRGLCHVKNRAYKLIHWNTMHSNRQAVASHACVKAKHQLPQKPNKSA